MITYLYHVDNEPLALESLDDLKLINHLVADKGYTRDYQIHLKQVNEKKAPSQKKVELEVVSSPKAKVKHTKNKKVRE